MYSRMDDRRPESAAGAGGGGGELWLSYHDLGAFIQCKMRNRSVTNNALHVYHSVINLKILRGCSPQLTVKVGSK